MIAALPPFSAALLAIEISDPKSYGAIGWLIVGFVTLIGFWGLGMAAINGTITFLTWIKGKPSKPTSDEVLAKLTEEMRGLAPSEKVDKLIDGLANAATKQELAAVMKGAGELVREEIDSHKLEVDRQFVEVRAYTHDNIHDLREVVNGQRILDHNERTGIHGRLNAITEVLFELRGMVKGKKAL